MKPVSTKILYDHCYGKYAIAAVNVFTMEQVHGLFAAAEEAGAPIIVQLTPVARNYADPRMLAAMIHAASSIYPNTVYAVHLDHGNEEHASDAIDSGNYTSVMIDASHDDFETNVRRTKAVVEKAHARNIMVEAELGVLSGVEDDLHVDENAARYTNPEQAKEFVARTGCDSLAIAIGTSHGAYKFSGGKGLNFAVLEKIQQQVPGFPLVLHGSSSVDEKTVKEINHFGGNLSANASGVNDKELSRAIPLGICKVNIATDLRLLWTKVHRQFFKEQPELFDPVIPGREYMQQYRGFMLERFAVLQSEGKANAIKQSSI